MEVKTLTASEAHSIAIKMRESPDPWVTEEFEDIMEHIVAACQSGHTSLELYNVLNGYTIAELLSLGYEVTTNYIDDQIKIFGYYNPKIYGVWTIISW